MVKTQIKKCLKKRVFYMQFGTSWQVGLLILQKLIHPSHSC